MPRTPETHPPPRPSHARGAGRRERAAPDPQGPAAAGRRGRREGGPAGRSLRPARAALARLDAALDALFTWRHNPVYHSGALVVVSFAILLATGLYLLVFYRIGAPWASVERITGQVLTGRWIRSLHRYASGLAVAATGLHALRMLLQRRSWGPRALAWLSGAGLLFLLFACGWTGYVMVWDRQAHLLAVEGARLFDALPLFSEPIRRAFAGDRPVPAAFFFLNLFLHIALPVGLALVLWVHVSRLARARLFPPRPFVWTSVGLLVGISVLWPVGMDPPADLLTVPGGALLDAFYAFWLPASRTVAPAWMWVAFTVAAGLLLAAPVLQRPAGGESRVPSVVVKRACTGCEQCYHDCPYEAISMRARGDGREGVMAWVDPTRCVSCGVCAGSCAPMAVGPPGRSGRDQLAAVGDLLERHRPGPRDVVLVACRAGPAAALAGEGVPILSVSCAGELHTSAIERLVRAGAGGVLVASCPPRDCGSREGATWLEARIVLGREAELKERVDRRRVRIAYVGAGNARRLRGALDAFRTEVAALDAADVDADLALDAECERETTAPATRTSAVEVGR